MSKVTIKDVAKRCNTSVRTVSRVVNKDPNVKKETREKIQAAIDEMGFQVNAIARSLKAKKTNQIVAFVDRHHGLYWGAFHNEVLQELHKLAKENNMRMVISSSSADSFEEDENDGFYLVKHSLCDGAVMFDTKPGDKRVDYLKKYNVPFVIVGKDTGNYDTPFVDLDNEYAGYLGAKHMFEKGYRSFDFLLGDGAFTVNHDRAVGFRRFCEEKGLQTNETHYDVSSMESAYHITKEIVQKKKLEGLFVSGDERTLGVYRALNEEGYTIGENFGVMSIDNVRMSEYIYPPLTTIDQSIPTFIKQAFDILMTQIKDVKPAAKRIFITPEIVDRESL
ncbi:LacI family transcriptional regulator [Halobacillus yeomjeoni]|uniref:LacI family DNA-binding transcriptional regulator n=1 Tax=Halobacillus yeomjeoni TaxID=311194 RepID=UPI001CD607F4|nr:LacI family DNA-binding transcriptional regulator [Halobacillus yeomjeoni]MCA0984746.1 LacI family transcriptional regulator [Halobacillus yeomjeoni]